MKINLKQGCRRIVIVFLFLSTILVFFCFWTMGFIWDNSKFYYNTYIVNTKNTEKKIELAEFVNSYSPKVGKNLLDKYYSFDFECFPYKQYCQLKNSDVRFKNNQIIEIEKNKTKIQVKMPTKTKYILWQLQDFSLIIIIPYVIYLIYLFLEFLICWIIRGFKV